MSFHEEAVRRLEREWRRMLEHPFLTRTRDGALAEDTFATWLRQDYLFVREALTFVGTLAGRAPDRHREPLGRAMGALLDELELFRERATSLGVSLEGIEPGLVNHAYVSFLRATVHTADYAEAFAVYYGAEKAYHESWGVVAEGLDPSSPWWPFVENWAGEEFGEFVGWLQTELDELAVRAGEGTRERMHGALRRTVLYEIAFWEMALTGPGWPGTAAEPGEGSEPGVAAEAGR